MGGLREMTHPLVNHHLARLRDRDTAPTEFRQLLNRLARLLAYEATQDLATKSVEVTTPLTTTTCQVLASQVGLVPILRAGLGMVDPILELIPTAEVWHLGVYRDEATAMPVEYYRKLPQTKPVDVALVLDPMLATGGSATAALAALKSWGVQRVKLLSIIAARAGVERVAAEYPEVTLHVCAVDPLLNEHKYIVPGLGDAGDRCFNTVR
ncbi:MAG TPA: uracil phosphoribosyltransferase [Planctomycetaceae bacterium]|nr:uracil phosphoribosyltransferase [Planctomycetaceae bacterium]